MQQRMHRVALVFGASLLMSGALLAVACGTDNGDTETPLPKADSGAKKDGSSTTEEETDGSTTPTGDAGADADCTEAPKVRDNTNAFYCSFRFPPDGGVDSGNSGPFCNNDEVCCNPNRENAAADFPASFCALGANATACQTQAAINGSTWAHDGGTAWECADKNQCAGGQVCCLTTQPGADGPVNIGNSLDQDIPKACGAKQAFKFGGTRCAASCAAGTEIKLCGQTDQNCPAGQACTPFTALFRDLAYCK